MQWWVKSECLSNGRLPRRYPSRRRASRRHRANLRWHTAEDGRARLSHCRSRLNHRGRDEHARNSTRTSGAREAGRAARILGRLAPGARHPDGRVENTYENRLKVARRRQLRPRVAVLPLAGSLRHPSHLTALSARLQAWHSLQDPNEARSRRATASSLGQYRRPLRRRAPDVRRRRHLRAIRDSLLFSDGFCRSQYEDQAAGSELFPQASPEIRERIAVMAGYYGLLAECNTPSRSCRRKWDWWTTHWPCGTAVDLRGSCQTVLNLHLVHQTWMLMRHILHRHHF